MTINSSEYVISSPVVSMCPKDDKPEYAFIGRSNVGKSSLINMLCRHKNLAKTSSPPGKTLLINRFIINKQFFNRTHVYGIHHILFTINNKLG